MSITRRGLASIFILCLIMGLGWLAYAPALSGALLLDDVSNLNGLAKVEDLHSALLFIFSGNAGPLGRPIALATFALQADTWGESAEPFILVNILIHLLNGCLLSWVLYRLAVLSRVPGEKRALVAIAAAAIWLFMPLLASASLMIIQRMTTLSATFVLLGLGGYLHAREGIDHSQGRSLVLMSVCLVVATALAVLTKETGALLPIYVLVLEATVLPRPTATGRGWTMWKTVFLVVPMAVIACYLVLRVPYHSSLVLTRGFTGWERLITEAGILWEYLFNALVPRPGAFGPFHDGYPVAGTILDPLTLLAVVAWTALLVLAIRWRRRCPLLALGLLWFLAGHSLESTLAPLELYFEHRNYLPIIGPLFALCALPLHLAADRRRVAYAGIAGYILINAGVLFSCASLWGNPALAARYWQTQFPDSVRAATTAAEYRLAAEGPHGAMQSLHRVVDRNPRVGYLLIPALNLSCIIAPQARHDEEVSELAHLLRSVEFSKSVSTMLSQLYTTVKRIDCKDVDGATVKELADVLNQNPRYRNGTYKRPYHQLMARVLRSKGKFEQALGHLVQARDYGRGAELNMMIVTTYADLHDYAAAREYIATARSNPPLNPFRHFVWESGLDELETYLEMLQSAGTPSSSGRQIP